MLITQGRDELTIELKRSESTHWQYASKTSSTPSTISSPSLSLASAVSTSALYRSCPSAKIFSAALPLASFCWKMALSAAADRPEARGRMFSFCDSRRVPSIVGSTDVVVVEDGDDDRGDWRDGVGIGAAVRAGVKRDDMVPAYKALA